MLKFHGFKGSVLRDSYKDFADMATKYDTLYLCNAAVAGIGEGRFHPEILKQFAKELWEQKGGKARTLPYAMKYGTGMGKYRWRFFAHGWKGKAFHGERTGWRRKRSSAAWRRCSGRGM